MTTVLALVLALGGALSLYIVVGSVWNYAWRRKRGWRVLPHAEQWVAVGSLVVDGISWVMQGSRQSGSLDDAEVRQEAKAVKQSLQRHYHRPKGHRRGHRAEQKGRKQSRRGSDPVLSPRTHAHKSSRAQLADAKGGPENESRWRDRHRRSSDVSPRAGTGLHTSLKRVSVPAVHGAWPSPIAEVPDAKQPLLRSARSQQAPTLAFLGLASTPHVASAGGAQFLPPPPPPPGPALSAPLDLGTPLPAGSAPSTTGSEADNGDGSDGGGGGRLARTFTPRTRRVHDFAQKRAGSDGAPVALPILPAHLVLKTHST